MLQFTTLTEHVEAVRWTIRRNATVWSGVFDLRGPHHVPLVGWPKTAWRPGRGARQTEPAGSAESA